MPREEFPPRPSRTPSHPSIRPKLKRVAGAIRVVPVSSAQLAGRLQFDFHCSRSGNRRIGAVERAERESWVASRRHDKAQPFNG